MKTRFLISGLIACLLLITQAQSQVTPGDSIHAVKYVIDLQEVDVDAKTITANTNITLVPLVNDLDIIQLQLLVLTIDSVFVDMQKILTFTHVGEVITIPLQSPISIGDTTDVLIYYNGEPFRESWGGFHFSGTYAFNLGVGISWIPHNLGKSWFPCIDDFTDRAVYEVRATVPMELEAIGGGELLEVIDNGDNTHTFRWYIANPIPTYLASIAIGDYELVLHSYPGIEREIPITYYVRPQDTLKVPGSFTRMNQVMNIFETKFGAYDWHRVGYVGTQTGAMEHATNIAYPNFAINGNSGYEGLYVHELSHMWFGDKVTCDKAEEMWINEGWATFCAQYYRQVLDGTAVFKDLMRDLHIGVQHGLPSSEGGYHPLNDIPQEYTYGTYAYDHGATVVQALRAYLGDDVFFDACKDFLEDLAFTSVSSYDMEANFSQNTGIDMSGFFNNWVYQSGTPHYSLDSFNVIPSGGGTFDVNVHVKQKRHGPVFMGDGNIIEFSAVAQDWQRFTDTIHFDGQTGSTMVNVPFEPVEVFLDLDEKYMDATIDHVTVLDELGETNFGGTYFSIDVTELTDSVMIQVTHNYAPPDSLENPLPDFRLSDYRYWTIKTVGPEPFSAIGRFMYSKSGLDNTLILSATDSVVIMYRENAGMEWQSLDFTVLGNWSIGYLYVDNMQMGDYALGVLDISVSTGENQMKKKDIALQVFPNPSSGKFTFTIGVDHAENLEIYSYDGRLIESMQLPDQQKQFSWMPAGIPNGSYIAVLRGKNNEAIANEKIVYSK